MYNRLEIALNKRESTKTKRVLKTDFAQVDFFSNDYLGFAKNKQLHQQIFNCINKNPSLLQGATGSRLISGNSKLTQQTEHFIAFEHQCETALLYPSGYMANLGLFSSVLQKGDFLLVDEKIHRSVHDASRMTLATKWKFKHNDLNHLEDLLKKANQSCFIAVESLYSMDGDFAPLKELIELSEKYQAALIVDEAHAFGVFGYGILHQNNWQNKVFASVITYGKAMGMHGAVVLGASKLKEYLINFSSPFIYSTANPDLFAKSISIGYEFLKNNPIFKENLNDVIQIFTNHRANLFSDKQSPIQRILFKNQEDIFKVSEELKANNLQTFAVYTPTVSTKEQGLRVCLHSFNTFDEIKLLTQITNQYE